MRERLERRKKKTEESKPAPPPLQPAYFGAEESSKPTNEPPASEPREAEPAEAHAEEESEPVEGKGSERASVGRSGGQGRRAKGRRRRGGRGRGGRGREQAVAQAFTPKGVPVNPAEQSEIAEAEPVEAEPVETTPAPQVPAVPAVPVPAARPPKGIVVLAIGLPGSGKSSWFKRHNLAPLSSDIMRTLLFDDVREQRFQDLVFSNLRSMLKARLIAKRPMNYVDATNLTPQERQHWIKLARDYNYEVHAVFFDVPLEVCIERHQGRDRVVPEDIMRRMAAKLKPPTFDEGFAKITVVRVKKKEG